MKTLATATSAALGGCAASVILYPLDTLKTRMQNQSKDGNESVIPKDVAGVLSLYKGVGYKATQSTLSKFLYFYAYTNMTNMLLSKNAKSLSTFMNLIVGYLAELFHLPLSLPLEVIITRMQTSKNQTKQSFMQLLQTMWEENEGKLSGFYKGFSAYFVLCLQPAIQFTAFEQVKIIYLKSKAAKSLSALEAFILGAAARSLATLVVFPYIRAKVLVQAESKSVATADDSTPSESIPQILSRLVQEEGVGSLYRGLSPELTKGALSAAFMLMVKEKIEAYVTLAFMVSQMYMAS
ncbi:Mitochondrial Carrier (MC) Family [Thraustotheca clavata]|uniref:Mitochondrial Carrier (MC) Family n=1 Tax=Thraustotheca clavata TaxID=74557 RepID=A0A1W0A2C7_9STRA|nr:Mitochondrial Carrier (MC) Family [Thraustotheca clavata]